MTAPTEQEIRVALVAFLESPSPMAEGTMRDALLETIKDVGDALDVAAFTAMSSEDDAGDDAPDWLWRDLRRSEARRLRDLVTGCHRRRDAPLRGNHPGGADGSRRDLRSRASRRSTAVH